MAGAPRPGSVAPGPPSPWGPLPAAPAARRTLPAGRAPGGAVPARARWRPALRGVLGGTTPARLRGAMLGLTLLAALAGAVSLWAASSIRDTAQTIGRDSEPSVALALRMRSALADMDAAALADALTDSGAAGGTSATFHDARDTLAADLVEAARNVTYGEAEAAPLRELQRWALAYQEAVAEARTFGAGNPWVTVRRVQWASRVNRDFAAPQADLLSEVNQHELDTRYVHYRSGALLQGGMAVTTFVLLVLALLAVQAWLARRTRRTLNPLLAGATLVAAAAGLWLGSAVLTEREGLRGAKDDAYNSLLVLFEAKGAVNALRADMSMWLLDADNRGEWQKRMDASVAALAGPGADLTPSEFWEGPMHALALALGLEERVDPERALAAAPKLGGYLGKEIGNITYGMAERVPASESISRLRDALLVIRDVQARERTPALLGQGQAAWAPVVHAIAVADWLKQPSTADAKREDTGGKKPSTPLERAGDPKVDANQEATKEAAERRANGGAGSFTLLQRALDQTIKVNQKAFERSIAAALRTAALMPLVITGALVLTALLALGGLWQRLREYR